ncbi:MAG: hypothetical protein HQK65_17860 [Desulfamplus sp.]|nr:hypothetical protein [Desulfamplus sp.]
MDETAAMLSLGYTDWLFDRITEMKAVGKIMAGNERKFNEDDILSINGKAWNRNMARSFLKAQMKKREGNA